MAFGSGGGGGGGSGSNCSGLREQAAAAATAVAWHYMAAAAPPLQPRRRRRSCGCLNLALSFQQPPAQSSHFTFHISIVRPKTPKSKPVIDPDTSCWNSLQPVLHRPRRLPCPCSCPRRQVSVLPHAHTKHWSTNCSSRMARSV